MKLDENNHNDFHKVSWGLDKKCGFFFKWPILECEQSFFSHFILNYLAHLVSKLFQLDVLKVGSLFEYHLAWILESGIIFCLINCWAQKSFKSMKWMKNHWYCFLFKIEKKFPNVSLVDFLSNVHLDLTKNADLLVAK